MKRKVITIDLSPDQQIKIRSIYEQASSASESGQPGMIIGHIQFDGTMICGFVAHEEAIEMQKLICPSKVGHKIGMNPHDQRGVIPEYRKQSRKRTARINQ